MTSSLFPDYEVNGAVCLLVVMHRKHPEIPATLPEDARRFIETCFHYDSVERPTASQLLSDPYIQTSTPGTAQQSQSLPDVLSGTGNA